MSRRREAVLINIVVALFAVTPLVFAGYAIYEFYVPLWKGTP